MGSVQLWRDALPDAFDRYLPLIPKTRGTDTRIVIACALLFDWICDQCEIEHRLPKPSHPWTNGQVEV